MKVETTVQYHSTGYVPRKYQKELHGLTERFQVVVTHRRFGKTIWAINKIIDAALRNTKVNPNYAYIAPFRDQAKKIAWDQLKWYLRDIPGVEFYENDLKAEIYKAGGEKIKIMLLGAENPMALKGIYLDGVVFDEFAECDPIVWTEVVRPTLSDRLGWAVFCGTPKGQNHFYKMYQLGLSGRPGYVSRIFKASETGILSQTELDDCRITMPEEEYMQEYEVSFTAAMRGSYYGKLIEDAEVNKRITDVPYDPALPVITSWDLGIGDTTAIWFMQQYETRHHAIDYYEQSGVDLGHYMKVVKEKAWMYSQHRFPHDVTARSLETGNTREEVIRTKYQLKNIRVLPKLGVDDGINAVRVLLPKVYFDKVKCERGIEALKNYQKKWDSKHNIFSDTPMHNWASNGADSFRYYAMGERDVDRERASKNMPREAITTYDIMGF